MKRTIQQMKKVILCCLLLLGFNAFAQQTLKGTVIDSNNMPLAGANVVIEGTTTGTVADFDGNFALKTTQQPPFVIRVSSVGYEAKSVNITSLGQAITVVLAEGNLLDEVIVSASRKREKVQEAPAAVSLISAKKMEAFATANPIMGLKNLTGVDIAQYGVGEGRINLRGKSTAFQSETFVIADYRNTSIPSFGANQYGQNPVDALDLDRVEVIKGPGSALYGPGVEAGVVHFISKSPFKKQGLSFSIGGGNRKQFQTAFRYATVSKNNKLGFKLTGHMRSAEDFFIDDPEGLKRISDDATTITSSVTGKNIGVTEFPDYDSKSYSFNGTLEYRLSDKTTITATGGYSVSEGLIRVGQGEGYSKLPRPYAQLRMQSGGFFAQAFWSKQLGGDNTWLYGTGNTQYNDIDQYEGQAQYNFGVMDNKLDLTIGADYRLNITDSKGSIYGKYEDEDDYKIYGAYVQGKYKASDKLDVIAAGRVDRFEALEETSFSPRLGVVYKHSDNHTFRATYNHSTGAPVALNLYTDLQVGTTENGVPVWLNGGAQPLTFQEGKGFIGGGIGEVVVENGLPLAALYQLVAAGFAGKPIEPLVNAIGSQITGTTAATLVGDPIKERAPLESSTSDQIEIGYVGRIAEKFKVTVDAYYNKRVKNLTATIPAGSSIVYASAGQDLHDAIAAVDNSGWTNPETSETLAQMFKKGIETQTIKDGKPAVLGFMLPDQQTRRNVVPLTFYNIESVDYFGVDAGVDYFLNDDITIFANASWLSKNYWDKVNILNSEQTVPFALNVPDLRAKLGVDYLPSKGFTANAAVRYRSEFESVNGASWTGTTESSTVVDASLGYIFSPKVKLNLSATNVFDTKYRPIANAPFVRRLLLAKLTVHID
ncbi:MAG: TonB-dependent receptor [Flavobacteriaceae bacterium]|nr:TonB-dependent receptor [Flavobacteriaceae bacterium]